MVDQPFTVINADDFYGPTAFSAIYEFLANNNDPAKYAMVGYRVRNTVTEYGSVARGVCEVENGLLTGVTERRQITVMLPDEKTRRVGQSVAAASLPELKNDVGGGSMFYKNARIFCSDFTFRLGAFEVIDGKFGTILPEKAPADAVDLEGATVIPGLIDVHSHGNSGADFSDGDYEGLKTMAVYYASVGVTSFAPASMTLPYEQLEKAFANARKLVDEASAGLSVLRGIQMEGPYFSYKKRGAQNADYLKEPDFEGFKALQEGCGGLIRIVDIAPELPGAAEFVEQAKELCTVSVAHTDSDYDHAKAAFDAGATYLTHLFNAMPGIHHRNPGVIPAAVENKNVRAELICDGLHVHPASVRLAFSMFGSERMVLVSDSGRCCGMPDGSKFELGGQDAWLRDGVARLADGTIACSSTNLYDSMVNAIRFGVPEEDAVRASSYNPACAIAADKVVGSIETGKQADFLVCSRDYVSRRVFLAGKEL